jgi:hypothetical protein
VATVAKDMYSEDWAREWPAMAVVPPPTCLCCKVRQAMVIEYWRGAQGAGLAPVCQDCSGDGYGSYWATVACFWRAAWWLNPDYCAWHEQWISGLRTAGP